MKLSLGLILLYTTLFGAESFITQEEYAKQLYYNPRGIGCHLCHGDKGEGKQVATYEHKGVAKEFTGPTINTLDFSTFKAALNQRNRGMPRYFLTDQEIKVLYFYLQQHRKKEQ